MCAITQASTVSGTVTTDSLLLHTHVCAQSITHKYRLRFRVHAWFWLGFIGSFSPEDWRAPCLCSTHAHASDTADMRQCLPTPTHLHNRTVTAGSLLLPHTCVLSHNDHYAQTTERKNKSGPVTLASELLQHTGGRACAIIQTCKHLRGAVATDS